MSCSFRSSLGLLAFSSLLALTQPASAQKPAPPATTPAPAAPATPAKETIKADDVAKLKDMVGREVTVTGRVAGTGSDQRSGMVFLNFSRDRSNSFVVVIKGAVAKAGNLDAKAQYEGKEVAVTGVITLFKDKPQIAVTSLEQIQVR